MFIQHWNKHARYDLDYFRNAYKNGIENGDLIFSGHSVNLIGMTRIMLGDNIDDILDEYGKYKDFQVGGKDPFIARNYMENTRMCLCLKGLTESRGSLNGDGFNEEEQTNYYQSENNMLGAFYFSLVRLRRKLGNTLRQHKDKSRMREIKILTLLVKSSFSLK